MGRDYNPYYPGDPIELAGDDCSHSDTYADGISYDALYKRVGS